MTNRRSASSKKMTEKPQLMNVLEEYSHYSPVGTVSLEEGALLVTKAIRFCRDNKIPRLLVDITQLTGFHSPMLHERYWIVRGWAHEAKGRISIAMVARAEMIDPQRFGVVVAQNAGLNAFISDSEKESLAWLLVQKTSN
jgi:hypothetical protein